MIEGETSIYTTAALIPRPLSSSLVCGRGGDGFVSVWDAATGSRLQRLSSFNVYDLCHVPARAGRGPALALLGHDCLAVYDYKPNL